MECVFSRRESWAMNDIAVIFIWLKQCLTKIGCHIDEAKSREGEIHQRVDAYVGASLQRLSSSLPVSSSRTLPDISMM